MFTEIFYNNQYCVPSGQPFPLFSENESFISVGQRWHALKNTTLQGELTGCSYSSILSAKDQLINIFSKDFQPFKISQDGQILNNCNYTIIKSIDFGQSKMVGILPYTINLECYPEYLFSGVFGILNPIDSWSWIEQENRTIELTHNISAQGFNTSSGTANSFDNAKNFVLARTGTTNYSPPFFISYCTGADLCLYEGPSESINRITMEYGVVEKYSIDAYSNNNIRYSTEFTCSADKGIATLNINGEVKSCRGADLASIRNKYQSFDVISAAAKAYNDACGRDDLNPAPLVSGCSENIFSKTINFQVSFDNDWQPKTRFDFSTNIKVGDNDVTTVGIEGTIKSRGELKNRWKDVENFYNNQLNLFYLANQSYSDFLDGNIIYPLNPIQLNYGVTKNSFLSEIVVSTSYNNAEIFPPEFKSLDYTIIFEPSVNKIVSLPLLNLGSLSNCNQNYYVVNLGLTNRAGFEIRGLCVGICSGNATTTLAAIKNLANNQLLEYCPTTNIFIDKNNISNNNQGQGNDFTFDFKFSADSPNTVSVAPFSFIDNLSLL